MAAEVHTWDSNAWQARDASAIPKISPADLSGVGPAQPAHDLALVWPQQARKLFVRAITQGVVLRSPAAHMADSDAVEVIAIDQGPWFEITGRGGDVSYIGNPNGEVSLQFFFVLMK